MKQYASGGHRFFLDLRGKPARDVNPQLRLDSPIIFRRSTPMRSIVMLVKSNQFFPEQEWRDAVDRHPLNF